MRHVFAGRLLSIMFETLSCIPSVFKFWSLCCICWVCDILIQYVVYLKFGPRHAQFKVVQSATGQLYFA